MHSQLSGGVSDCVARFQSSLSLSLCVLTLSLSLSMCPSLCLSVCAEPSLSFSPCLRVGLLRVVCVLTLSLSRIREFVWRGEGVQWNDVLAKGWHQNIIHPQRTAKNLVDCWRCVQKGSYVKSFRLDTEGLPLSDDVNLAAHL